MARVVTLVVPASSARMLARARALAVDEVVVDLEDGVAPERKSEALGSALNALEAGFAARRVSVRVNPPRSAWAHVELVRLASVDWRLDTVVVPKVGGPGDLAFVERLLDGAEAASAAPGVSRPPIGVQALIETAEGVANLAGIASASRRLEGLVTGYADLALSLGRLPAGAAGLDRWSVVQDLVVIAARAAGLRAVDGPFLSLDDRAGLDACAARAAAVGFDGKWAIHPSQLDPIRRAFTPSEEAVAHARAVIDALAQGEAEGVGAVSLDREMIDQPVRMAALRTLSLADDMNEGPE